MKKKTIKDLARDVGLSPLSCHSCGKKLDAVSAIELLFKKIVDEIVAGNVVELRGFGSFSPRVLKARHIPTTMFGTDGVDMPERLMMSFKASENTKKVLKDASKKKEKRRGR